jgi:hypothetical protein
MPSFLPVSGSGVSDPWHHDIAGTTVTPDCSEHDHMYSNTWNVQKLKASWHAAPLWSTNYHDFLSSGSDKVQPKAVIYIIKLSAIAWLINLMLRFRSRSGS